MPELTNQPSPLPLTETQRKLLRFIFNCLLTQGQSPTFRELMDGMGYRSTNAITNCLLALQKKGYIDYAKKKNSRRIRVRGCKLIVEFDDGEEGQRLQKALVEGGRNLSSPSGQESA